MPQQRRFRRLGKATTAISAGALVLVITAPAPAMASARAAAASAPCPKGHDPASTIENWKCQLGKLREKMFPAKPTKPTKPAKPAKPTKTAKPKPEKKKPRATTPPNLTPQPVGGGGGSGGPTAYTRPDGLHPYTPGTSPNLPGILPSPQVAADLGAQQGGLTDTRLIAPVAASERQGADQMLWVALAAGTAGAVGAMNISVISRRVRRRPQG